MFGAVDHNADTLDSFDIWNIIICIILYLRKKCSQVCVH